jgi:hypothetical protein
LQPKTVARMFQGIQIHRAVERVLESVLFTGDVPPQALATDTFSDEFEKQKNLIEDWEGEDPGQFKDIGVECTRVFHQNAVPNAMPLVVEKTFSVVIEADLPNNSMALPVLGRIDSLQVQALNMKEYQDIRQKVAPFIQEQKTAGVATVKLPTGTEAVKKPLRIHDLKVVTDKWSEADLENDLQFMLYAGVEHIPDVQVDQLVKGRAKVPRPRYEVLTGVINNGAVRHGLRVAQDVAKSIATGHFPLTDPGNWWCSERWCSMWRHCRGRTK